MIKEIIEKIEKNLVRQILTSVDILYNDIITEIYTKSDRSKNKKEIIKLLMDERDDEIGVDVNEIFSNVINAFVKKFGKAIEKFPKDDIQDSFREAGKKITDPIKREIFLEIKDIIFKEYL